MYGGSCQRGMLTVTAVSAAGSLAVQPALQALALSIPTPHLASQRPQDIGGLLVPKRAGVRRQLGASVAQHTRHGPAQLGKRPGHLGHLGRRESAQLLLGAGSSRLQQLGAAAAHASKAPQRQAERLRRQLGQAAVGPALHSRQELLGLQAHLVESGHDPAGQGSTAGQRQYDGRGADSCWNQAELCPPLALRPQVAWSPASRPR